MLLSLSYNCVGFLRRNFSRILTNRNGVRLGLRIKDWGLIRKFSRLQACASSHDFARYSYSASALPQRIGGWGCRYTMPHCFVVAHLVGSAHRPRLCARRCLLSFSLRARATKQNIIPARYIIRATFAFVVESLCRDKVREADTPSYFQAMHEATRLDDSRLRAL